MRRSSQRLIAILSLVAAVAALAVFAASGSNAQTGSTPEASTAPPTGSPAAALVSEGEKIYSTTCIACHQAGGKGVAGQVPALAGDALVNLADPHAMVQTVLNGRGGMPSFSSFSDEQVAAITSYVRQAFGNHASAVNPALVTQVRAQFQVTLPVATPLGGPGTAGASVGAPGERRPAPTVRSCCRRRHRGRRCRTNHGSKLDLQTLSHGVVSALTPNPLSQFWERGLLLS